MIYDGRYKAATLWSMSEADIMKENGVYGRLYKQEPKALPWYSYGASDSNWLGSVMVGSLKRSMFSWSNLSKYSGSARSRETNVQKLWTRPTI